MNSLLARALTALLSVLVCGAGAVEVDRAALVQLAASVWKVEALRVQGGFSLGSGVAVAPDLVLTNCHVTRDARVVHVLRGGRRWRAEAQAVDAEHDLCLLHLPGLAARAVTLGRSSALWPGEPVSAFGYSGGMALQHSAGRVVALHRLDGARVIQSSNAFASGASGGGLFDARMQLVGILTFRLRGGTAHAFSAPLEWLQPLLEDGRLAAVEPLAAESVAYWQRAPAAQPEFLRATVLEREQRWDELEGLAFNWTRLDGDDPQAWYLHGLALSSLQRWPESRRALERSLQLEPGSQLAWFRLGLVHAEQGQFELARQARGQLENLQSDLAGDLARAIDKR